MLIFGNLVFIIFLSHDCMVHRPDLTVPSMIKYKVVTQHINNCYISTTFQNFVSTSMV